MKHRYNGAWPKIRSCFLNAHPLREICMKEGWATPAEEVHHKIDSRNPGKRNLTALDFTGAAADLEGLDMPPPKEYLAAKQKNGKDLVATEVYKEAWKWLADRGCAKLVPQQLIEQYSMAISRWIQCEESITEFGFLAKHPTTGSAIPSPYVAMSQSFGKIANNLWFQIYQVVKGNCTTDYKGATPHDDMMERLLAARRS